MLKSNRESITKLRPSPLPPAEPAPSFELERSRWFSGWTNFWFAPTDAAGLHWLRFLSGLLFIFWLLPLAGHVDAFFGLGGWFDREAYLEVSRLRGTPEEPGLSFGWSILYVFGSNAMAVRLAFWGTLLVFALFALGVVTRITGILTWVLVGSFLASPATSFDADYLLVIPALYLMLGYLAFGQWSRNLSPLERIFGPRGTFVAAAFREKTGAEAVPSYAANLAVRLFQVHFAIVVVTGGLHKLQSGHWWGGYAFWFPLTPPFETTQAVIEARAPHRESYLIMLSATQYLVLAWQLGFPLFAWRRGLCRLLLLGGAVAGWVGSVAIWGLPLFGPVYLLGCLSFLSAEEWSGISRGCAAVGSWLRDLLPERTEKKVKVPVKA